MANWLCEEVEAYKVEIARLRGERANLIYFAAYLIREANPLTGRDPIQIAMTNMIDYPGRDLSAVNEALAEHDRKATKGR